MTATTPATRWALYYRSSTRGRGRTWRLHAVFATRSEADTAASEIGSKFRHLDLWISEAEPAAATSTEMTAATCKNLRPVTTG